MIIINEITEIVSISIDKSDQLTTITIDEIVDNTVLQIVESTEVVNIAVTEIFTPINIQISDVGLQGIQGDLGFSAYEIAVNNGFIGTEAQWLNSLTPTAFNVDGGIIF
jgi:hypothetical protein